MSVYTVAMSEITPKSTLTVLPEARLRITKADRTRAAILNAALEFVWSHHFNEMTVGQLMKATGVSRSAFYQYFSGLHEIMETLLEMLGEEIFESSNIWITGVGDPVALLNRSMTGLIEICYKRGPFLRSISDAASIDRRLEKAWNRFLQGFDDAGSDIIERDQKQGLIPEFDARPMSIALNRLNASTLIHAFGTHPRSEPEPIRKALARIWVSTLYGNEWTGKESSNLVRK